MDFQLWLTFLGASLLISVSPGAGAITTMSHGIRYGLRNTLPFILGLQLGYIIQVTVVGIGLGAILAASAVTFEVIKWLGVGYLIWLGYQKFTEKPVPHALNKTVELSAHKQAVSALFINLSNPKVTVFLVAFFPQFIDHQSGKIISQYLVLGSTVVTVDFFVLLAYAYLGSGLSNLLNNEPLQRIQNRLFGGMYVGVAGVMAAA
ncbi:LysE family transporter [Corallincola platygyrae]|uniref:LysE family transporter n=1 Tax=Corallincola platygyrae TaxID=1193278 RepID=A0ABW4XPS7_9GAMM